MLVLTLEKGPEFELVIGDEVVIVTILSIKGGKVRVGIAAPKEIPINRRVVYERIKAEREAEKLSDASAQLRR